MKQLLLLISSILSILILSLPASAQTRQTVTLEHEGALTVFEGVGCFDDALAASADGDTLYFSEGEFGTAGKGKTISKSLSLIGTGYGSYIVSDLTIKSSSFKLEGLKLENIELYGSNSSSSSSFDTYDIKNSQIRKIYMSSIANYRKVFIEGCYVTYYSNSATDSNVKAELYNSKIKLIYCYNHTTNCINCNIGEYNGSAPALIKSCILGEATGDSSYTYVLNSVILSSLKAKILENNYIVESTILDDNLESTVDLVQSGYLGTDGTEVGVYGGQWNHFSENPTLPTVDSKNSSVEYDPTSNQLKVNIQLLPE